MPMPLKEMTGVRVGRLVVICRASDGGKEARWRVKCDCGGESVVRGSRLRNSDTLSCGCIKGSVVSAVATRHGMDGTRTQNIWRGMISRTTNSAAKDWERYGGRGISVCAEWTDFENFLADMGPCPTGAHTLDRVDNDGPYTPNNCRWATMSQQCRNKSNNRLVEYRGRIMPLIEACELAGAGVDWHKARNRMRQGRPVQRAVEQAEDGRTR